MILKYEGPVVLESKIKLINFGKTYNRCLGLKMNFVRITAMVI